MTDPTPEQAAEKVVGKYTIHNAVDLYLLVMWKMDAFEFVRYLKDEHGIAPCTTCGAYRRADRCEVCEKREGGGDMKCPEGNHGYVTRPERDLRDGEPCNHFGCERHIKHPCEGCGRIGARGEYIYRRNIFDEIEEAENER